MKTFENPFIIDPILGLYLIFFFFLWYDKLKEKNSHIDFRIIDVIIVIIAYLFFMFAGIYK